MQMVDWLETLPIMRLFPRQNHLIMKTPTCILVALGLFLPTLGLTAQEARFFRVAGPVPVTITAFTAEGYITWSNAPTN